MASKKTAAAKKSSTKKMSAKAATPPPRASETKRKATPAPATHALPTDQPASPPPPATTPPPSSTTSGVTNTSDDSNKKRRRYVPASQLDESTRKQRNIAFTRARRRSSKAALRLVQFITKKLRRPDWRHFGLDPVPVETWLADAAARIEKHRQEGPRGFRWPVLQPKDRVCLREKHLADYAMPEDGVTAETLGQATLTVLAVTGDRNNRRVRVRFENSAGEKFIFIVRPRHLRPLEANDNDELGEGEADAAANDDELDDDGPEKPLAGTGFESDLDDEEWPDEDEEEEEEEDSDDEEEEEDED